MLNRIFQKNYLLWLAALAGAFHLVLAPLRFFVPFHTLTVIDFILLGLAAAGWIVYAARRKSGVPLQGEQALLIGYLGWFLLSCVSMSVVQQGDWVAYNMDSLLDVASSLLLFFPLGSALARNKPPKGMTVLLHIILLGWSLFILWVLVAVFRGQTIATPNGGFLGMEADSNNFQLNNNRNMAGSWESAIFLCCFTMAIWCRKPVLKGLYILSVPVHYAPMMLTNCRTAYLVGLAGCIVMAGIALYINLKKQKKPLQWLITLAGAAVAGFVYYILRDRIFDILASVTTPAAAVTNEVADASASVASRARDLLDIEPGSLPARVNIWKFSLKGVVSTPQRFIFGITPASIGSLIRLMSEGKITSSTYTHNQIMEVLADTGVGGLCIFGAWLFLVARNIYRLVFVEKNRTALLCLPAAILGILMANMMEAFLLFYSSWVGYIFFFLCGFLHGSVNGPGRELTYESLKNMKLLKRLRQ